MESHTLSPRRQLYDKGLRVVLYFCGFLTCALLVLIIGYIFYRGVPFISWELLSTQSSYITTPSVSCPISSTRSISSCCPW